MGSARQPGAPLYLQIVEKLRDRVTSGTYAADAALPSEAQLTKEFKVSRVTVRQALAELESGGLIYRRQGRGTFVNAPHLRQQLSNQAETIVEALRREGIEPDVRIVGLEHTRPDPQVAAVLGTGDEEIAVLTRLYVHNEAPIAQSTLHLPLSMAGVAHILAQQKSGEQTTYSIFESMGLVIKEAKHVIRTVSLDPDTAKRLHMKAGDVCLATDRITYSAQGNVLELTRFVYPPERMRFEITLPRNSAAKVLRVYSGASAETPRRAARRSR
jgi:GntR family transcriptional regulator